MKKAVQIALSATVWIALGVPLWKRTIEVDRADLDFAALERYEALATHPLEAGIRVGITDPIVPDIAPATELVVNDALRSQNSPYRFIVQQGCTPECELCLHSEPGENDLVGLDSGSTDLQIRYQNTTIVTGQVPELARMLLLDHIYKSEIDARASGAREEVTIRYSPQFHLTFSLFSEMGNRLDWDIGAALKKTLGPLLTELDRTVANITIDTQTALYAEMAKPPHVDSSGLRVLDQSELATFADFAEWKLASSLPYPTLNFVLYVPDTPLEIDGTSKLTPQFIIPQWGGLVIVPPRQPGHEFSAAELAPVMDIFARQLLALLGLREQVDQEQPSRPATEVQLARLSRDWAMRGLRSSASSLGSLRRLALSMPHIAIPQEVWTNAELAMRAIDDGVAALARGQHADAAWHAHRAHIAAEQAFFDKHMVAQAYFPDEHKLAVYMPLIGPLCVVVFSGWIRIKKNSKKAKASTKEVSQEGASGEVRLNNTETTKN